MATPTLEVVNLCQSLHLFSGQWLNLNMTDRWELSTQLNRARFILSTSPKAPALRRVSSCIIMHHHHHHHHFPTSEYLPMRHQDFLCPKKVVITWSSPFGAESPEAGTDALCFLPKLLGVREDLLIFLALGGSAIESADKRRDEGISELVGKWINWMKWQNWST